MIQNLKNMQKCFLIIMVFPFIIKAQSIPGISQVNDDSKGVQFEKNLNWQQVLAKAKAENKYIFLDCFATWCGPCKLMDKNVYPNDTVGNYFNQNFISVKVQMDETKN